jgi:hypothetical protein
MKINKKSVIDFVIEYKWILIIFIIFLVVQIYQTTMFFWDPFVYHLNGQWFCGNQVYFEFLRPPLPSAVNCLVGAGDNSILLTQIVASFVYLIAGIVLFKKEAVKNKIDQLFFALFFFLAPQIFLFGNFGGDYFAIAFLVLAISVNGGLKQGLFFGLATLSRYNFFFYIVLLIDYEKLNVKKVSKIALGILLVWMPWLIYNYSRTQNLFFSIEETTYLNFLIKGVFAPVELYQILLIGFFIFIFLITNLEKNVKEKTAQAGIIALAQFVFSGIKEARFLNVFVPFQATKIGEFVNGKNERKLVFGIIIILILIMVVGTLMLPKFSKEVPAGEFIYECRVMSDNWVYLYSKGIVAEPLPGKDSFFYFLENGVNLVIYDQNVDGVDFKPFEKIKTKDYTLIKSNLCEEQPSKYELLIWRGDNPQE